jgi:hypothetical protein
VQGIAHLGDDAKKESASDINNSFSARMEIATY